MKTIHIKAVNIILLFTSLLFFKTLMAQQQYPNLYHIVTRSAVSFNRTNNIYYYTYAITNSSSSRGELEEWGLDISIHGNTIELDTIGLRFKNDGYTEKMFRRHFVKLQGKIVPVGFSKTPVGRWTGALSDDLTACFWGIGQDHIFPGNTKGGFEIMSKGLPSIRQFIASPYFDVIALFPDPKETTKYYVPPIDSVRNAVNFYGWTIGPTAPPTIFSPIVWLDTLTNYTTQSLRLDWIKNQTTANKYLNYFTIAKKQLEAKDNKGARITLHNVVTETINDSNANITNEAYALLRFNTEYQLSKIP